MGRIRVFASILSIALFGALAAGCSSPPDAPSSPLAFAEFAAQVRADAATSGASNNQLAILDNAIQRGEVKLDDLQLALESLSTCLEAAGLGVMSVSVDEHQSPPRLGFAVVGHGDAAGMDDTDIAIADACSNSEYDFLSFLYDLQPSSIEAATMHLEAERQTIAGCLDQSGVEIDPALDASDFRDALSDLMHRNDDSLAEAVFECLAASDIYGL